MEYFENSVRRFSFLCCLPDIETAWINHSILWEIFKILNTCRLKKLIDYSNKRTAGMAMTIFK